MTFTNQVKHGIKKMDNKIKEFQQKMKIGKKKGNLKTKVSYNDNVDQTKISDY